MVSDDLNSHSKVGLLVFCTDWVKVSLDLGLAGRESKSDTSSDPGGALLLLQLRGSGPRLLC